MDGILLLDKPQNFTSFDAVAKLRGILKTRKIGHTGTLDPMATGLLVILTGSATPLCDKFPDDKKSYKAGFSFGFSTDTEDVWGKVIKRDNKQVKKEELTEALKGFTGEIMQIPPMYSAIKIGGKKLCDLAREGKEVKREPRKIIIDDIRLLSFDENTQSGFMEIFCRKGTYIRTLIKDIGESLGTLATMTSLERTSSNGFSVSDAIDFEEAERLMNEGRIEEKLIPAYEVFKDFKDVEVPSWQAKMIENGVKLNRDKLGSLPDGFYRLWHEGKFLGAVEYREEPNLIMIFKGK